MDFWYSVRIIGIDTISLAAVKSDKLISISYTSDVALTLDIGVVGNDLISV